VFFAEKATGLNDEWFHKLCFRCAEPKCKIALQPGNYQDHQGKMYCKRCYNSAARMQGYGFGNSLDSYQDPHGVHPDSQLDTTSNIKPF